MSSVKELIQQAVARGWCSEKNSGKAMDSDLALAIADEVDLMLETDEFSDAISDENEQ